MSNNVEKKLTFDDVLLVPRRSSVLPKEVNCATNLTRNITLNIPKINLDKAIIESLLSFKRAGACGILSYFSIDAAKLIKNL